MDITISPGQLSGTISAIPSKSQAHRFLICASFADHPTVLFCPSQNQDIEATADCLSALGAEIVRTEQGYSVTPVKNIPNHAVLPCRESGSTLRFLLPVAGALGVDAVFQMEGRLPKRPLSPLWEELERMGCHLSRPSNHTIVCSGKLRPGNYHIAGNVSSQFISGLLLALPLLSGDSTLEITGPIESRPYIRITQDVLGTFGVCTDSFHIPGIQKFHSPGNLNVEGDWSNSAFFLAAKALGSPISVTGLNPNSVQGDRAIETALEQLHDFVSIDATDIPDLIPILSVAAACRKGAVFTNIQRLRLKESDRVQSVIEMIEALGGKASAASNALTIWGTGLEGGTVSSAGDHRIAMAAAIAATACKKSVTVLGAESVQKSYPRFWEDYKKAGGHYEQHIR